MTAEEAANVQAYASIAGVAVTALGLIAILVQIRASSHGTRGQNSSMFLLGDHRLELFEDATRALSGTFELLGSEQMTDATAAAILDNKEMDASLSALINYYETVAAGIRCGSFDERMFRFAYMRPVRLLSWQLIRYIRLIRERARNDKVYSELEQLAAKWDRWSDAAPHFFRDGEVIVGVPYEKLPVPTDNERRRPRLRRH